MPLVFVHGVNVRRDIDYDAAVRTRDELFRTVSLKGTADLPGFSLLNPYWGDQGATFPYNHGYIPSGQAEAFGSNFDSLAASTALDSPVAGSTATPANSLVILARQSLPDAIDALVAYVAQTSEAFDLSASLAHFGNLAHEYAESHPNPAWLAQITNNAQFIDRLNHEVGAPPAATTMVEGFGSIGDIGKELKAASLKLGQRLLDAMIDPLAPAAKRLVLLRFTRFFGDVFFYIHEKRLPDADRKIHTAVRSALLHAAAEKAETGHKLVVVGHSMGGNIAYDLLSHSCKEIQVDLFLTVGSQVGLFEELKQFDASVSGSAKVPRPPGVSHWLNVYDPSDPFGYAIEQIFTNGTDYRYDTNVGPLSAHSAYLYKPGFHRRLAKRLQEVWRS